MNWHDYRALCDRPDYWSRWMLEQSIEILESMDRASLKSALVRALESEPLEKPADHKGSDLVNMHRLACPTRERAEIAATIGAAKSAGVTTSGTLDRGLGGFEEAWAEYARFEG